MTYHLIWHLFISTSEETSIRKITEDFRTSKFCLQVGMITINFRDSLHQT